MKNALIILVFLLHIGTLKSQDLNNKPIRFIQVTGSAELEVEPDEVRLIIGIEEYWKEEFGKKTEFKDFKTKVPINEIETSLIDNLAKIGINKESIIIKEVGNTWRYRGKEFLVSKQLEIVLYDFRKVDEIINAINAKGIDYMRIGEFKNKDITEYRKQVKIEALKAAKAKAGYLLESIDKKVGDIISIVEIGDNNLFWSPQLATSNSLLGAAADSGIDNVRKIKLRYEIEAKFEIK